VLRLLAIPWQPCLVAQHLVVQPHMETFRASWALLQHLPVLLGG
jgi:hypothetical protein